MSGKVRGFYLFYVCVAWIIYHEAQSTSINQKLITSNKTNKEQDKWRKAPKRLRVKKGTSHCHSFKIQNIKYFEHTHLFGLDALVRQWICTTSFSRERCYLLDGQEEPDFRVFISTGKKPVVILILEMRTCNELTTQSPPDSTWQG